MEKWGGRMDSLAQQILDKLAEEQDIQLLIEVLDFYEYIKKKRQMQREKTWDNIQEDEPTEEEKVICNEYQTHEQEFIDFSLLVQELSADDK